MAQQILGSVANNEAAAIGPRHGICFSKIWITKDASFAPCFIPVVAAIPTLVAILVLLGQILKLFSSSLGYRRPQWMRPFVEEVYDTSVSEDLVTKRRWTRLSITLLVLSAIGTTLSLAATISTASFGGEAFFAADGQLTSLRILPWLISVLEICVFRPKKVPYAVLTILITNLISLSIMLEIAVSNDIGSEPLLSAEVGTNVIALITLFIMPFRDPILPSQDISKPATAPTAALRSPEEALSIWQFLTVRWLIPMLDVGGKRQMEYEDVWSLPQQFQHARLHENFRVLKGTVIKRLLIANGIDLVIVSVLGFVDQFLDYASPFFLQLILSSMEDPERPKRVALTYAGLSLIARLLSAQFDVVRLWYGRRSYERSRGEMITMLYEKTLARKMAFKPAEKAEPVQENGATNGHANDEVTPKPRGSWWSGFVKPLRSFVKKSRAPPPVKEPASMGRILNLMRNDVYEVAQRFWEFDMLLRKPIAIILSVTLVVNYLGPASMMAVGLVVLAQIMNAILARVLIYYEKKRRFATDSKLQIVSQFVEAIRHLRWYGWQDTWLNQALSARQKELMLRVTANAWNVVISFVNVLSYDLVPVVAFFTYTVIAGKPLTVDIAFPSIQLFSMMTSQLRDLPGLIIALINAWVAVQRIEDFMAEPDLQEMATEALIGDQLALDHASFAWPGASGPVLKEVNISFPEGLTVVFGEVAAGKTALLQALLGELDMLDGQLIRPPEPIGYCAQTPWLQSMSIRENILFSAPYEDERYRAVLDACALTPDLAEFKSGDLSLIGENGIGLSGGQKARVALARAVYSRTKILLLDDPLAALDQQTAEYIVQQCFGGPLLKGRTVVLITHRTDLVLGIAEQLVKLERGKASLLDHDAAEFKQPAHADQQAEPNEDELSAKKVAEAAVPAKFIEDEHRAYGGVKASVYWEYIKAGNLWLWALTIATLVIYRFFALLEAWFIKSWAEAYNTRAKADIFVYTKDVGYHTSDLFDDLPPPEVNIKPWLITLALLAVGQSLSYVASQASLLVIVYVAAKNMFRDVMQKVAYATFRFYDTTPVGRLMNRMTSDIGVIDGGISRQFSAISWMLISWISAVVVIASITPAFLVFTLVLAVLFVLIYRRFIPASQNLRRLEMVSLTPLMSNFGELLNGLATVRAFAAQSRFQDRVIHVVDTFQKMDHFYWSTQAWLMYRYDSLASVATFLLFALALATDLSPGLTAFALLYAQKFVHTTNGLCRQYGQLQMEFVSVERVVELLHLEQEPKGTVSPPAWWPSYSGDIVFKNVLIKYAPHLDPALAGISFTVKGGSKTAIIGRTGSGKSTLALSLLATILPEIGRISIDEIDLAEVDKQLLRSRITFLAQDPVLFPGSMRMNLDPVSEHTDEECETVLGRVCARQGWDLKTDIEAGGKNLSQGQRQLVGLARAVLRRSAIIILDEATASIDRDTAMQIQQVMHEDMKESTVITIAHRLEAVRNADYCIVLGKGKILEQGPAQEMLRDHKDDMIDD
ncbi:putative AAA+ ATPase domain, ABC transporter type 1, transmembrane domain-containing protein [Septoria linicola]|nr:putative AAA+ ATPase domain, ABC transporter type 1, transmembrane domain-containing protein [Septoria linicola]